MELISEDVFLMNFKLRTYNHILGSEEFVLPRARCAPYGDGVRERAVTSIHGDAGVVSNRLSRKFRLNIVLKPMYSLVNSEKRKSLMGFVYEWILKALWIVLSETNKILRNLQEKSTFSGCPRPENFTIGACILLPLGVIHCWILMCLLHWS